MVLIVPKDSPFNEFKETPAVQEIHTMGNSPSVSVYTYGLCQDHSRLSFTQFGVEGMSGPGNLKVFPDQGWQDRARDRCQ